MIGGALLLCAAAQLAPRAGALEDFEPPIIEDIAAAASDPAAQPVITAMISDRGAGVATATVHYRARHEPGWRRAELKGGRAGLFIARLPDGLQRTGFEYYVEAVDAAGNGPVRIGSPEAPIEVERATVATRDRVPEPRIEEAGSRIHPGWLMLSLGAGVLAGAGAGAYGIDLLGLNNKIGELDAALARTDLSDEQRARIGVRKDGLEGAAVQDAVIASVLGVVSAAAVVTGTALLIASALE
jgi:hypothetical protein